MSDSYIHRKGKFRRSLCGKEVDNERLSLFDQDVTCPECRDRLKEITGTTTQLRMRILGETEETEEDDEDMPRSIEDLPRTRD